MAVSKTRFREVLGHLAAGVAVVTSRAGDGEPRGLTATAVCSVSLDPPLVLACIDHDSSTFRAIRASGVYAINLLGREHASLAALFSEGDADKFGDLDHREASTGAPVLETAVGYCDCRVERAVDAGDHTIFVGAVEEARLLSGEAQEPLLYHLGRYRTAAPGSLPS